MRESLFRAAQRGEAYLLEETVGQFQDEELTGRVHADSFLPLPAAPVPPAVADPLVVWPYPAGTADLIDRANCADHFVRVNPAYRVLTPEGSLLCDGDGRVPPGGPTVVFASFEWLLPRLAVDPLDGYLVLAGRRIDAVLNEMTLGHLARRGSLPAPRPVNGRRLIDPPRTHVLNGTQIALDKGAQLDLFAALADVLRPFGVAPLTYLSAPERELAVQAAVDIAGRGRGAVLRPFAASQGTGIAFVDGAGPFEARRAAARRAVAELEAAVTRKYGVDGAYPITITPFVESTKIGGAVTDLRLFVVHDPHTGGLHALPGVVRRAQRRLAGGTALDRAMACTNLNGNPVADPLPGPRMFPLADERVLDQVGLSADRLTDLGRAATTMWAAAVRREQAERGRSLPFCYGSVDVLVREGAGAVLIEMNGANVGMHPSVHPRFLDAFARASTGALASLGLGAAPPLAPLETACAR